MKKSVSKNEVANTEEKRMVPTAFDRNMLDSAVVASHTISPPGGSSADIIKLQGDGEIVVGQDKEALSPEEEWILSPADIFLGFICWKDGSPVDQLHRSLLELASMPAYTVDDLPDHGPYNSDMDGWSEQSVLGLVSRKDGYKAVFPATSMGGRQAIQRVIDAIGAQNGTGSNYIIPIITVSSDSYFNKKFRKDIYFPVFNVVGWMDAEGNVAEPEKH